MCKGQVFSTPRLMISDTPHASGQQPAVGAAIDVAEEDRPAAIAPLGHLLRQAGRTTRAHRAMARQRAASANQVSCPRKSAVISGPPSLLPSPSAGSR